MILKRSGLRFALCAMILLAASSSVLPSKCAVEQGEEQNDETDRKQTESMSEDYYATLAKTGEKLEFHGEVNRFLDLIINAVYQNREVSIRELISNAADALERMRFLLISQNVDSTPSQLEVRIEIDKEAKTISITDTGVGMSKQDLINNLGTVAKSGTANFLEAFGQGADLGLIGQFGVGFYAAFLIADKVTVLSKCDEDDQYAWVSSADASYTVAKDPNGNTLGRGTRVILHLKDDATEFLNEAKLKELAARYSQFLPFPIYMKVQKTVTEEIPEEKQAEADVAEDDVKVKEDDQHTKEKKGKKVEKIVWQWERVNPMKAIWLRKSEEISEEEYNEFYKSITKDYSNPLAYTHFSGEGEVEFKTILYIPAKAPVDMFENYFKPQTSFQLYVQNVLVADKFDDLLPKYLHFIKGVVNSNDLSLNVSRDQLQQSKMLKVIAKKIVKKTLQLIKQMASDSFAQKEDLKKKLEEATNQEAKDEIKKSLKEETKFDKFWKEYSRSMKLGCYDDDENKSSIAKLLLFQTSKSGDNRVSFAHYLQNNPNQKNIYYVAADTSEKALSAPPMQIFSQKDIEVLLLTETMDELCIQKLNEFEGKKLVSIEKGDPDLEESDEEKKLFAKLKKVYEPLTKWLQQQLSSAVQRVELSRRLVTAPCAITAAPWGYSAQMEKIMKSQTFADPMQVRMFASQKVFEINPKHRVIIELLDIVKKGKDDAEIKTVANKLFQAAMLASGYDIQNPNELSNVVYEYVAMKFGVPSSLGEINIADMSEDEADEKDASNADNVDIDIDEKDFVETEDKEDKEDDNDTNSGSESEKDTKLDADDKNYGQSDKRDEL